MDFIKQNTPEYLLEVTEEGTYTEIAHSEFNQHCYETVYTDFCFEWAIYISHERTVTFAGEKLLAFVKDLFMDRVYLFNRPRSNL